MIPSMAAVITSAEFSGWSNIFVMAWIWRRKKNIRILENPHCGYKCRSWCLQYKTDSTKLISNGDKLTLEWPEKVCTFPPLFALLQTFTENQLIWIKWEILSSISNKKTKNNHNHNKLWLDEHILVFWDSVFLLSASHVNLFGAYVLALCHRTVLD